MVRKSFLCISAAMILTTIIINLLVACINQTNPYFIKSPVESFGLDRTCNIVRGLSTVSQGLRVNIDQCMLYNYYQTNPSNLTYPSWISQIQSKLICAEKWSDVIVGEMYNMESLLFACLFISVLDLLFLLSMTICILLNRDKLFSEMLGFIIFIVTNIILIMTFITVCATLPFPIYPIIIIGTGIIIIYSMQYPKISSYIKRKYRSYTLVRQ